MSERDRITLSCSECDGSGRIPMDCANACECSACPSRAWCDRSWSFYFCEEGALVVDLAEARRYLRGAA
jgi:hypothetical protein